MSQVSTASVWAAPRLSMRWWPVFLRNLLVWRKLAIASVLGNIADPLLYMLALGYGIGSLIGDVGGMSYIAFIGTGMVCQSAMFTASFEGMYSAFSRMHVQRTWEGIINAPYAGFPQVGGPSCGRINKRYELDADNSGRLRLYASWVDCRLHLFGAERGEKLGPERACAVLLDRQDPDAAQQRRCGGGDPEAAAEEDRNRHPTGYSGLRDVRFTMYASPENWSQD